MTIRLKNLILKPMEPYTETVRQKAARRARQAHVWSSGPRPTISRLDPAASVIKAFNSPGLRDGAKIIAEGLGLNSWSVTRWALPKESGGSGGVIPIKYHQNLLDLALRLRKRIKKKDLLLY